jgi:HSP20 family protein
MKAIMKNENQPAATQAINTEAERTYVVPDVNIFETEAGYLLEADMPGVNRDGLEVTIEHHTVTLVGHRSDDLPNLTVLYRETKPASFRRVFEVDPSIDTTGIRAQVTQGVLTLELPKVEAVKPRRIAVE